MHAADGRATEGTSEDDSPPGDASMRADGIEGCEEDDNWDEEGEGCEAARVGDLQGQFSLGKAEGVVSDEVLYFV